MNAPATLRRVAVIGDVHGEDRALEAALAYLKTLDSFDAILCTGDLIAKQGIGDTERCCQLLQASNVLTIRGNHDRWYIQNQAAYREMFGGEKNPEPKIGLFLRSLPPLREFHTPRGRLLLCHGIMQDDMSGVYPGGSQTAIENRLESYGLPGNYRLLIAGHTHERMVRPFTDLTIINAGTLRWEEYPCFLAADFETGVVQFYDLTPLTNEINPSEAFPLPAR